MSNKVYIGIDNGVSGSIGVLLGAGKGYLWLPTPTKRELNYTKAKRWINRVDAVLLLSFLSQFKLSEVLVLLERPMVNPMRFQATASALRSLEATLVVLEQLSFPFRYVDSREWQREMLPSGLEQEELKKASFDVGKRLFPMVTFKNDADSLLMAEWARRHNL